MASDPRTGPTIKCSGAPVVRPLAKRTSAPRLSEVPPSQVMAFCASQGLTTPLISANGRVVQDLRPPVLRGGRKRAATEQTLASHKLANRKQVETNLKQTYDSSGKQLDAGKEEDQSTTHRTNEEQTDQRMTQDQSQS